jgi:hypothetical protein
MSRTFRVVKLSDSPQNIGLLTQIARLVLQIAQILNRALRLGFSKLAQF